jgi:hypothetical protein
VADTSSLKTMYGGDGQLMYLQGYSSADTSGGGWFIVRTSSETTGTNYFDHPDPAKQWVRQEVDALEQGFVADTTALKALAIGEGKTAYLKQLSSTNTNGGGWFVVADSAYAENLYTRGYVYSHPTAGYQWLRNDFLQQGHVNLEWYGAIGDGSTDDATSIQNALNSSYAVFGIGGTEYRLARTVDVTDKNIILSSNSDKKIIFSTGMDSTMFFFQGSAVQDVDTLDGSAIQGRWFLDTQGDYSFSVGDLIWLKSDETWYTSASAGLKVGEVHKIMNINDDSLWVEMPLAANYNVDSNTVRVMVVDNPKTLDIKNVHFKYDYGVMTGTTTGQGALAAGSTPGIQVEYYDRPQIENVQVDSSIYIGIYIYKSYRPLVQNYIVKNCSKAGSGYGINIIACMGAVIDNLLGSDTRHPVDIGGGDIPAHYTTVQNSEIHGTDLGPFPPNAETTRGSWCSFSSHAGANNTIWRDLRIYGATDQAFFLRGDNESVINCQMFTNSAGKFIQQDAGVNLTAMGNIYRSNLYSRTIGSIDASEMKNLQITHFLWINSNHYGTRPNTFMVITNNHVYSTTGSTSSFIHSESDSINNAIITGNTFSVDAASASQANAWFLSDSVKFIKSVIKNNTLVQQRGNPSWLHAAIAFDDSSLYEFDDLGYDASMRDSTWTVSKTTEMDSATTFDFEPGIRGDGTIIVYDGDDVVKCTFRLPWAANVTILDSTGSSGAFAVDTTPDADKFSFDDTGTFLQLNNKLGKRDVHIRLDYRK